MIKGTILEEDRHHKPLDALTTKKQRCIKQKSEREKKKYILTMRHVNIPLRIFYPVQKK